MPENPGQRAQRTDFVTWALALIGAAALVWAGYQYWRSHSAAVRLADLERMNREAEAGLHVARAASRAELRQIAALQAERLKLEPAPRAQLRFADPKEASRQFMAAHPEARELGDRIMKELAESWPRTVGRAAGFSEAQLDAYAALFARQKGIVPYVVDGIRVTTSGDLSDVQGGRLKQLVGDDLYAKYQAYLSDEGMHDKLAGIADTADVNGTPLSPEQDLALSRILRLAQTKPGDPNTLDWEAVEQQAAALLSGPQLDALRRNRAISDQMSVEQNYRDAFMAAAGGSRP